MNERSESRRASHRTLSGMNSATIRASNRSAIFEAIRHYAPISRKALAEQSGLNPATVTHIVDDLLAADLVVETRDRTAVPARTSRAGRKPLYLAINADARFLVGLDLSRTRATVVVTNLAAEVHYQETYQVPLSHSAEMAVDRVLDLVAHAIRLSGISPQRLGGIGIGAPGPLNVRTGTIMATTFEGWAHVPLKRLLEERFRVPVTVDNDANTAALAEQWFGAGRELATFVHVIVDAGVGAGIIVNGHLFVAGGDLNPEFGHTSVRADGPLCACGNRGCLELYCATPNLIRQVVEAVQHGRASSLAPLVMAPRTGFTAPPDPLHQDYDALTPAHIWQAVEEGDPLACEVVGRACQHLAMGLANLVALFHPTVIFLGRDLGVAGPRTYAILRQALRSRAVPDAVRVLPADLDAEAPAVGAVTLALRTLFVAPGL